MKYIVIVCIVLAAVYFGWVTFSGSNRSGEAGVTVTIDKDKVRDDKDKVVDKAEEIGDKTREKINDATSPSR